MFPSFKVRKVFDGDRRKYAAVIEWYGPTGHCEVGLYPFPKDPRPTPAPAPHYADAAHATLSIGRRAGVIKPGRNVVYESWHLTQFDRYEPPSFITTHRDISTTTTGNPPIFTVHTDEWETLSLDPRPFNFTELWAMIPLLNHTRRPEVAIDWLLEKAPQPLPQIIGRLYDGSAD